MKIVLVISILVAAGFLTTTTAQDRFRRDYKHVVVDIDGQPDKSGEYNGHNIFIFNYNENADVMHITSDRNKILYVRTSPIEEDQHENGVGYSFFKAINENGDPVLIKIFHKEKYGVQLFTNLSDDEPDAVFHFLNLE